MDRFALISTVTDAAGNYDLAELADVKAELGIADTAGDAVLGAMITRLSKVAASYCRRIFNAETVRDEFIPQQCGPWRSASGSAPLLLSRYPVISVTSLTEGGAALVENTDYRLDKESGQAWRIDADGDICDWPATAIVATYQAGFATIPEDLQDAVIRMVKNRWFAKGRDTSIMQESIPGVRDVRYWVPSGSEAGALTPDVQDILNGYRIPVIG